MKIFIVGGGAAGFFCAINTAIKNPDAKISILERNSSPLTKVRVSGGGRCNLTNACENISDFIQNYPRGSKELYQAFHYFSSLNLIEWFEKNGLPLKSESDKRVFPSSNSSQTVIDLFLDLVDKLNISLLLNHKVNAITKTTNSWTLLINNEKEMYCDKLVITSGGNSNLYGIVNKLGHTIINPLPSLFSFNSSDSFLIGLQGLSHKNVKVNISGTKYSMEGDILITHSGVSGPVIIKLSSVAAIYLSERNYQFTIRINWSGLSKKEEIETLLKDKRDTKIKTNLSNFPLFNIPIRLWDKILSISSVDKEKPICNLSNKDINLISQLLFDFPVFIKGKSPFKDEFVTCGGIDLKEIDFRTMESRIHKNLYFAGEILNIDGLTGGFNFQSAWTTGYIAAMNLV